MKLLGSATLAAALLLVAIPSASAGPIVCPPHNPTALANFCIAGDLVTAPLSHPSVGGFYSQCIVSNFCVPLPTVGTATTNTPDATLCGTYVWVVGTYVYRAPCFALVTTFVSQALPAFSCPVTSCHEALL